MAIDVLGPVRVEAASPYPRELAVLVALVVRDGRPITAEELSSVVWPDGDAPATWNKQIQAAIARLRKMLGAGAIVTTSVGYHLDIDPAELDARRFEALIDQARELHRSGEPDRAVTTYRRALDLWRGRPYDDIAHWHEATDAASDLERLRIEASEGILRARLDAGDAVGVIPDAERLVREEPLRESRWTLLALACYRAGRQADALSVLRAARERLADELGVDAGHEIDELERAILQHDNALDAAMDAVHIREDCPYRGLGTFREEDAEDFYGREADVAAALRRLEAAGLLVVTGASGSGKSSMIRAGVVPSLRRRGKRITVAGPDAALEATLREGSSPRSTTDVIVIDQFEEILQSDAGSTNEVTSLIVDFVDRGGTAILTVRSDYLDVCAADPALGPLMADSVLVVAPLGDDALRRVIEEPAAQAGLRLEPGLVELMLRDCQGSPGILPHLSHALAQTWARREGRVMTVAGYEASGGIAGAIAQSADRLFTALDDTDQELCRTTLLRMVVLAPDGVPVRRRLSTAQLKEGGAQDRLFEQLTQSRLVSVEGESAVLAHEAVTRAWPRFRRWLQDGAEDLVIMGHLEAGAEAWDHGGRTDDDLARGARLQAILELRDRVEPTLTTTETAYLEASAAREQDEKRALAESARVQARQNRRLKIAIGGVVGMLVVALVAGGLAVRSAVGEASVAGDARIDATVNESAALRDSDRIVSALIAAEAYRQWPEDVRTRAELLAVLASPIGGVENMFVPGTEERIGSAMIPGTDTALVLRDRRYPELRSVDTGELVQTFDVELPQPFSVRRPFVRVSADGSIATVTSDHLKPDAEDPSTYEAFGSWFTVLDLENRTIVGDEPILLDRWVENYTLSPSGRYAAYADVDGYMVVVDVPTRTVRVSDGPITDGRSAVSFADDDAMLVGTRAGDLYTVNPQTFAVGRHVSAPPGHVGLALAVADDGTVIGCGESGAVRLDSSGAVLWTHTYADPCAWVTLSPASDSVFLQDSVGVIREHRLDSGAATGREVEYQYGNAGEMWVRGDGSELLLFSTELPSIGRWRLDGALGAGDLVGPGLAVWRTGFDPSGRYVLMNDQGNFFDDSQEFTVWDAETGRAVARIPGLDAFWAGAGIVRTVTEDRENIYYDVSSGESWEAPVHDHERSGEPFTWAEIDTDRTGDVMYEMDCCKGIVRAVDPRTGEYLGVEFDRRGPALFAHTTPDGAAVVLSGYDDANGDWQLSVHNARTGEVLADAHTQDYLASTVTPDGRIVTGKGNVIVLDTDLKVLGQLPPPSADVQTLEVSADDRILLATTDDNHLALYELESGAMLGSPLPSTKETPFSGTLHPSGTWLLANTSAGVVWWSLDPDDWLEQVCAVAGRNFTEQEWETHMSALGEYRQTCTFPTA